jgi:16S rRNA (guanine966-N2)-methyltransferase
VKTPAPAARRPRATGARSSSLPREVRIIGGLWKRSKLPVLDRPGLRPTPDRVRETLFNWLGQDLDGWRCLDAFAGTGALGLEAASRGAAEVLLLERDAGLVRRIRETAERLKATTVRVDQSDAVSTMGRLGRDRYELVFLDPPFDAPALYAPALRAAAAAVVEGGFVYLEADRAWTADELAQLGLVVHKQGRAGQVHFHLLQRPGAV